MKRSDLKYDEIGEFYWRYINLIPEDSELVEALDRNTLEMLEFFKTIPADKWGYRYEPEKWSVLDILQHLIDTERIFQYRALCFARGEQKALPGFDHDFYVVNAQAADRDPSGLIKEFRAVRESGSFLFRSFSEEMLSKAGNMNEMQASPRAIGFIMPGHALHHKDIIEKRYL